MNEERSVRRNALHSLHKNWAIRTPIYAPWRPNFLTVLLNLTTSICVLELPTSITVAEMAGVPKVVPQIPG